MDVLHFADGGDKMEQTVTLKVGVPREMLTLLGVSRTQAIRAVIEFSALGLYQEKKISSGKAAELLGMTKREFIDLLAQKGIPYFDYSEQDLEEEWQAVNAWKQEQTAASSV
jgi:predicted HTH domain antitoxin